MLNFQIPYSLNQNGERVNYTAHHRCECTLTALLWFTAYLVRTHGSDVSLATVAFKTVDVAPHHVR